MVLRENDAQPGTQIDLLIDRREHVINLCEIRHTENEFVIDKDTDLSLRTKREVFRSRTGQKTVQIILISTYGIKPNTCSSLISGEVILDDLFAN